MSRWLYPEAQKVEALRVVVRGARLGKSVDADTEIHAGGGEDLVEIAARLGVEARPIRLEYGQLQDFLEQAEPCLLRAVDGPGSFVAIVRGGRRSCRGPGGPVRTAEILEQLTGDLRQAAEEEAAPLLGDLPAAGREKALRALAEERIRQVPAVEGWVFRLPPGSPFLAQMLAAGLGRRLFLVLAAHALTTALLVAAWWVLGRGALAGSLDRGWLWAWALLLITIVPLHAAESWQRGTMAWLAGRLLKRRLLEGALRLDPDDVRGEGTGRLLGRVFDSERVEALAMNGGLSSLLALVELVMAALVLLAGAAPVAHAILLLFWMAAFAVAAARYLRRRLDWTLLRLGLTHRLVEQLVGHRTRMAQERRGARHDAEDREHEVYARRSAELDRWLPRLQVLVPRGWMILALAALLPAAFTSSLESAELAVSLGGVLLATGALHSLVAGVADLGGAWIAWRNVEPIFRAAGRPVLLGLDSGSEERGDASQPPSSLLSADSMRFRHPGRGDDAVRAPSLEVTAGDRILLEGPSGSGKSTLLALLAGLRRPDRGWLGLYGLDPTVWGERAWRRQVVCAPPFHENHLLSAPLAFNLLMGRLWPPTLADLGEARSVCEELGLGPLLEAMPAGLMQPVGDSGWQLSHGERSRVFLARALLKDAELVILDEAFTALDSTNLELCLSSAERRARALLVTEHV